MGIFGVVVICKFVHRHELVALELFGESVLGSLTGRVLRAAAVLLVVTAYVQRLCVATWEGILLRGHVALRLLVHLHILHLLTGLEHILVLRGAILDAIIEVLR